MMRFLQQLLDDGRGNTDEQALISLLGGAVFLGLEIYSVAWRGQNFDPFGFGAGIGALLGATSAGFGLRARWTPDEDVQTARDIDPVTGRFMGGMNAGDTR
ncbi:MAG: hypothetical protein B7Z75_03900 [Acidocella sp. 20-57-95]|nr:MAG: hypothetical protein B7Z75_03900 [Acidocella sp. 20-57-95]OYV60273.1 MAG: hypothetical protein B7Z71_06515 [Acidocella sp. 21-58-7]HQT63929.1 hypothetical protein [Acidocella sp.]HQU03650.1 hypothetical protein [Acidocella sp.]